MEASMKQNRKTWLDILRILSSVLVVGVHVSAFSIDALAIGSFDFLVANAFDCLSILGVPLFVMISGALELGREKSSEGSAGDIKRSLKRAGHMMLLYFFWLMCYNLLNCLREGYGFSFASIRKHVVLESLLGRGIYHLWFLPMLAGISLAAPFLKSFAGDRKLTRYFLVLYFLFTILLPTILKFQYRFPYYAVVEGLYSRIPYVVFTGYTGYFVLGHFLENGDGETGTSSSYVNRIGTPALLLLFLVFFNTGHLVCFYDSIRWGQLSTILNDPFSVTDFVSAGCIFLLVKRCCGSGSAETAAADSESRCVETDAVADCGSRCAETAAADSESRRVETAAADRAGMSAETAAAQKEAGDGLMAGSEGGRFLTALSGATLGVYILHPAILMLASRLGLNTLFAPQLISIPICIIAVYLVSLGLTLILKKVPGIRGLL